MEVIYWGCWIRAGADDFDGVRSQSRRDVCGGYFDRGLRGLTHAVRVKHSTIACTALNRITMSWSPKTEDATRC